MKKFLFALWALSLMLFSGCDKVNNDLNGRLVINVTDGPFPINFVESATVTITKIEIRKACDGVPDENPFLKVWEGTESFDLLQLRNGLVEALTDIEVPQGKYDLVRLYVDKAGLKIKDGGTFDVKVPSGSQTGIKVFINPELMVEGGLTAELLLDFDLSSSFVMRGNMDSPAGINGFIFKPVIRAANNTESGRIEGSVTDGEGAAIAEVLVEVMQEENVVGTAYTDVSGKYAVIGLAPGSYTVKASKTEYESLTVDDKLVSAGNITVVDFVLTKTTTP
ncbi:MAG: DUF4382 domain-containing protein [Bacteroidales bacterium]|nr:DUF4382 domain-containing protein [Bacteroidales bacterium]